MADNTEDLRKLIEAATPGSTVVVPFGIYEVQPSAITLKPNMTLDLSHGVRLRVIPNDRNNYYILEITGENITVIGGELIGDRSQHFTTTGEWGFGIKIGRGAKNVSIRDVTSRDMWGDGFYVGDGENIEFVNVLANNNRRQGMSITKVSGLTIKNSTFQNTHGTRPMDGIDIEPDNKIDVVEKVEIFGCKFFNNVTAGIEIAGLNHGKQIHRVNISNCIFSGNGKTIKNSGQSWWLTLLQNIGLYSPISLTIS